MLGSDRLCLEKTRRKSILVIIQLGFDPDYGSFCRSRDKFIGGTVAEHVQAEAAGLVSQFDSQEWVAVLGSAN